MAAARPTPAAIRRAIEAMLAAGLDVGSVVVQRDGSVRIVASGEDQDIASLPDNEEAAWDAATGAVS